MFSNKRAHCKRSKSITELSIFYDGINKLIKISNGNILRRIERQSKWLCDYSVGFCVQSMTIMNINVKITEISSALKPHNHTASVRCPRLSPACNVLYYYYLIDEQKRDQTLILKVSLTNQWRNNYVAWIIWILLKWMVIKIHLDFRSEINLQSTFHSEWKSQS